MTAAAGRIAAVTGGTGFLGSHVAAALAAAGWTVRLLVRSRPAHPVLAGLDLQLVQADLDDEAALSRLVQDAAVVVHCAGLVKAPSTRQLMAVNRDGAARLAAVVARQDRPAKFIQISSQAARQPLLSGYAASKRQAESAVAGILDGARCVVLRPCVIYGPWDREGEALLRLARGWLAPTPRQPEPRVAMIHVRDAAAAVVSLAMGGPEAGIFEICDERSDGYGWRELLRRFGAAQGHATRPVPVPDLLIMMAAAASEAAGLLARDPPIFGRGKAREILHRDWSSDPASHLPAGVWRPAITLEHGLAETVAWSRGEGAAGRSARSRVRTCAQP